MEQPQETIFFSIAVVRLDELRAAAIVDNESAELDRAYLPLGVTRVTTWIQRHPPYLTVLWEGRNLLDAVKQTAVSDDPHFSRWRGLTRIYAGPDSADAFWEATRHRIFAWSSGECGRDRQARVLHGTSSIAEYLKFVQDVQNDAQLLAEFDQLRTSQGFTRSELWHQSTGDQDVVISYWEAHDMAAAIAKVEERTSELDERILRIRRSALGKGALSEDLPEIVLDWQARLDA